MITSVPLSIIRAYHHVADGLQSMDDRDEYLHQLQTSVSYFRSVFLSSVVALQLQLLPLLLPLLPLPLLPLLLLLPSCPAAAQWWCHTSCKMELDSWKDAVFWIWWIGIHNRHLIGSACIHKIIKAMLNYRECREIGEQIDGFAASEESSYVLNNIPCLKCSIRVLLKFRSALIFGDLPHASRPNSPKHSPPNTSKVSIYK